MSGDGSGWACAVCTYLNHPSLAACEMCGTGNPSGPPAGSIADSADGLACHVCTFVNEKSARKCAMCESQLRRAPEELDTMDWSRVGSGGDGDSSDSDLQILDARGRMEFSGMFGPFHGLDPSLSSHAIPAAVKSKSRTRPKGSRKSRGSRARDSDISGSSSSSMFKDVSEIIKKEEGETERIAEEERKVHLLKELYDSVYPVACSKKAGSLDEVKSILIKLRVFVPKEEADAETEESKDEATEAASRDGSSCQVCLRPASSVSTDVTAFVEGTPDPESDTCVVVYTEECGHRMCCQSCMIEYCKDKIKEEDVTPWIRCPAPGCRTPLHPKHLTRLLDLSDVYSFISIFIRKHLKRNPNWIPCIEDGCEYGFIMLKRDAGTDTDSGSSVSSGFGGLFGSSSGSSSKRRSKKKTGGSKKVRCESCGKKQTVSRDPVKGDAGFAALLKDGTLRLCPSCEFPTMKDKGMCNVMKCGQCGIWWNWRSRETGASYHELKNKARSRGTLWEPGELAYQQKLQRSDPEAFKLLLERNGIPYDPSYVRGT